MQMTSKNALPTTNGFGRSPHTFASQQTHLRYTNIAQLIVSNLEPSVSLSEWRRILIVHFQAITKNPFQIQVMRQSESGCCAIVKMSAVEDAQIAISQLNRRKIGYRRIRVGFLNQSDQRERHLRKAFQPNQSLQQRFQYDTKIPINRSQSDNIPHFKRKVDKSYYVVPSKAQEGTLPKLDDPLCPKHQPKDPRECIQMANRQCMPSVMITLGELRSKVLQLLRDHNNILSVMSFTRCYEETFGPLNKAEFYVNRASEGEPDKVLVDKDSVLLQNYVPLEHLITCVPDVCIRLTANGIRVVTLSQDLSQEEAVASAVSDLASQNLSSAENLRQFRREVVELIKQQTSSALLLSRFIPTYHAHFGKQCRVSDYGFARLQDLIEALRGIVHVVGEGPLRTIMLTHVIQVRRFTHDLLRLIKNEQKKGIPIAKLPQVYENVFNKPFLPSNYGVCDLYDLLNDVPESKLVVENVDEEDGERTPYVVIPRRVQTAEQRARTQLFAVEVVDMLSTMQRFQIAFTKFIPAYHHAFNHQCRVAEYGFVKFIELLEAIPHVVEVREESGEKNIILTPILRLALIRQMLLGILEVQLLRRLSMNELVSAFLTNYQLILLPQDYGFETLEEMFTSFSEIFLIRQSEQQQTEISINGDEPIAERMHSEGNKAEENADSIATVTYVCLMDRFKIKQSAYRCLQILFNSPFGSIPEEEFKEHYRTMFQEEVDLDFVHQEMSPFISVRDYNLQVQDPTTKDANLVPIEPVETVFGAAPSRMVHLCPLILFARQLRFLLMRTRGRLMLNLVEQMYRRHFGVTLSPEAYGYPSVLTLINAVNFVVVVKGRGPRAILFLAQDYLGKLAWAIAYKIPFRHDLIYQSVNENTEARELSRSMIVGKEYLPPSGGIYQPAQFQIPWNYPGLVTSNGQLVPTAMTPGGIVPVNSFPSDLQQSHSVEYPLAVPGLFVPNTITQTCGTTRQSNAPGGIVYDIKAQAQELIPTTNGPYMTYPGVIEVAKLTPTYVPFYVASGEPPAQNTTIPTWTQPIEQQTTPGPLYGFPMNSTSLALAQQPLTYGFAPSYYVSPVTPIIQPGGEIGSHPANHLTIAATSTDTCKDDRKPQETSASEQQGYVGTPSLGNDELQSALSSANTTYPMVSPPAVANWLPQAFQQIWAPSLIYQNSQPNPKNDPIDGQLVTPQNGTWMTDFNPWLGAYRVPAQWPVFQTTPMGMHSPGQATIPVIDTQSINCGTMLLNGQVCLGNGLTFTPTPCRTMVMEDVVENDSQSMNKCEEGDWTLPISMTTESIDINSKENDDTGSIE